MKHLLLTTIAAVLVVGCGELSIHEAVYNGNIAAVKQHIAAGADVDLKNKVCKTSFFIAVEYGKKEAAEFFEKGAVVMAKRLKSVVEVT